MVAVSKIQNLYLARLALAANYSSRSSPSAIVYSDILGDQDRDDDDDDGAAPFLGGVLQDKDLLRKSRTTPGSSNSSTSTTGLYVLDLIDQGCLEVDRTIYNKLLNKCTHLFNLKQGRLVHEHILSSPFKHDLVLQNFILNMYAKCGSLDDAHKVFDEMSSRDMVTWTTLITGYSQSGRPEEALSLFPQMLRVGLDPNEFTLSSLLKASASGSGVHGRQLHAFSLKYGYDMNVYVGSSLVDMYARCGHMQEAQIIFDRLATKNEVSWNALIGGHARKSEVEEAFKIFWKMLKQGFKPTHFTYSSIFTACASTGSLEQGRWVHAHVIKSGAKLVAFIGNTLLHMYAKSGSIEDARKVFDRLLVNQNVVSWNSILTAYAQHGMANQALYQFEEMKKLGIQPNGITFLSVLTACSHAGLLDKGKYYFELMKMYKIEPEVSHYVTMVDLLGRSGNLNEAEKFIRGMPIEPTEAVWGALLGACRMHRNMELGAYAAERVFELDPSDSGPHVLLSNIYADAGRLSEAAKVRKMMKESGVKKEPACSWVEIENEVHIFVANDDSHPEKEEMKRTWEKISEKIKEMGYKPDKSQVLYFGDEQEREVKLQYHSEKLALAFSLLKTSPGSIIRIKKNIRVCGDCHSAFKFVSKFVGREIVLRDTNRFHHFRQGLCSCGDYW